MAFTGQITKFGNQSPMPCYCMIDKMENHLGKKNAYYLFTFSQRTNIRLFQTLTEFAHDNFKLDENGGKFSKTLEKHCGKRRNCLLRAISLLPAVFSKRLVLQKCKNQYLFGNGLTKPQNLGLVQIESI